MEATVRQVDLERLAKKPKTERAAGRTFDLLFEAIQSLDQYPTVTFLVLRQSYSSWMQRDIRLICRHLGKTIEPNSNPDKYTIDGKNFIILSVGFVPESTRGYRSHFVEDHTLQEFMKPEDYRQLQQNLSYCRP